MNYLKAFIAGFASTLSFHQSLLWVLNAIGFSPRAPWSMTPVAPINAPAVISLAFWGGLWGIVLWTQIHSSRRLAYWTKALGIAAVGPSLVAWFVVMPMKGVGVAGGWGSKVLVSTVLLDSAWGLGAALLMRLLNQVTLPTPK